MSHRWRDIPCFPILLLLHLIFTLSSLIVRLAESLSSPSLGSSANSPPRHLAIVLAHSRHNGRRSADSHGQFLEKRAIVESVKRLIERAGEEGVGEVSVWDRQGEERYATAFQS